MYSSQMMAAVQSRASFGLWTGQLCGVAKGRPARLLLLLPAPRPLLRSLQPLHRFWQFCQAASAILCLCETTAGAARAATRAHTATAAPSLGLSPSAQGAVTEGLLGRSRGPKPPCWLVLGTYICGRLLMPACMCRC